MWFGVELNGGESRGGWESMFFAMHAKAPSAKVMHVAALAVQNYTLHGQVA